MTMKNKVRFLSIKKNQSPTNAENRTEHRDTLKEYKKIWESKKKKFWKDLASNIDKENNDSNFWKKWKNLG